MQVGMSAGTCWCCRRQGSAAQWPASHAGHTATLLPSCTYLHRPSLRFLQAPVLQAPAHRMLTYSRMVDSSVMMERNQSGERSTPRSHHQRTGRT